MKEGELYLEALTTGVIPEGATGEKAGDLYEAQLALENAASALEAAQLVVPISGAVTAADIDIGDLAGESSVITVSDLEQPYALDAYLDADDSGQVQARYEVEVSFELSLTGFSAGP